MPRAFIVAILAACVLCAQDAPPALLARARDRILNSIDRLPKYTCLETIDRTYYVPPPVSRSRRAMTEVPPADSCANDRTRSLRLDAKDRLRIEVAIAGEEEIHSWPGASVFDTRPIDQMITFGPISSGSFGGYLQDIFANPGAQISFTGRKTDGGRDVSEYSFIVPRQVSHSLVREPGKWWVTGKSGSFEIDAAAAELARLVIISDPLPPDTGMCHTETTLDYHSTLIGDGEFLIPLRSELKTFDVNARQTDSVTGFSACHEYTAESSLRFDDQIGSAAITKTPQVGAALPAGVSLTLALVNSIDTSAAAAGDQVSARVTNTIRERRSKKLLVPAGAIARGRILQMRHEYSTSDFVITVEFDTLEIQGAISPLSVRLDRHVKAAPPPSSRGLKTRPTEFSLPPPAKRIPLGTCISCAGWFRAPARTGKYVFPVGFQSTWITVAQ